MNIARRYFGMLLAAWAALALSSCRGCSREEAQPPAPVAAPAEPERPPAPPVQPTAQAPVFDQELPAPAPQAIPMTPGAVIPLWGGKGPSEEAWAENRKDNQVKAALHSLYQYQQMIRKESTMTTLPASGPRQETTRVNVKKGLVAPVPEDAVPFRK